MKLRTHSRRLVVISAVTGALVIGVAGFAAAGFGGSEVEGEFEREVPHADAMDDSAAGPSYL